MPPYLSWALLMVKTLATLFHMNSRTIFAIACVAGLTLGGIVGCVGNRAPGPETQAATQELAGEIHAIVQADLSPQARDDLRLFARILERVKLDYVHEVEDDPLIQAAVQGVRDGYDENPELSDIELVEAATHAMLLSLDPYSDYLNEAAYRSLQEETRGKFGGLGIEITKRDGLLRVVSPIDGTPAQRAGLLPGDVITHADSVLLEPLSLRETVDILRGEPGTPVVLRVERTDGSVKSITVIREIIRVASVKSRLEGDIGYIRLTSFSSETSRQTVDALEALINEHGSALRGVILDLRNNPGGLLDQSVEVADVFLDPGLVVYTKSRTSGQEFYANRSDMTKGLPIVVLINGGSASASEIVAGALKDRGRALLLGEQSFGKGSVQTIFPLDGVRGMKLTTALYYTPGHRSVDGGIAPDVVLADDPETEADEQLDRALQAIIDLADGRTTVPAATVVRN